MSGQPAASDATGTNEGEGQPVIAFVARFPGGSPAPTDPPGVTMQHPRWVHGYSIVSPELIAELDARKQQIGQLELLAAAASYFSLATWLSNRDVFHYIDNTAAVAGIAKGYSATAGAGAPKNRLLRGSGPPSKKFTPLGGGV